jgi:hypothetical protein
MTRIPTILERAFELARSGHFASIVDLKKQLKTEGYTNIAAQMFGPSLGKQLRALIDASAPQ